MVNLLRKHQQFLMILITIMVIIAFVWLYNGTRFDRMVKDEAATIYGRAVARTELERQARRFQLCADLGLFEMLQDLAGGGFDRDQMYDNFIWNSFVLRHEAGELHVRPTDDEVAEEIQKVRPFQTDGQFDSTKYNLFVQERLTPLGFTTTELEETVRDLLRLRKIKTLLGSTMELSETELRDAYTQDYQKSEVSVIRFSGTDFQKGVQLSEDDLHKAFEQRKDALKSGEKRKLKYVVFGLTADEKKLSGKERIDALQKLANRASEFTQAMTASEAKFEDAAAKSGVPVLTTGEISETASDPALANVPAVTAAAFHLTPAEPNSDVIQSENGFYVLRLENVIESRPLTFAEAQPQLTEQLRRERSQEAMSLKAAEVRNKIDAEVKMGKSFTDAAAAAGQKVEKIPAFAPADAGQTEKTDIPDLGTIQSQSAQLAPGELSQFIPNEAGGVIIHLDQRLPLDEEKYQNEKAPFAASYLRGKREIAFREWLRVRKKAADIQVLKS